MNTVVFTGGGTGGHIFPGLAVIDELQTRTEAGIVWIGSSRGIDRELVESQNIRFYGIPSGKFRRYFSLKNFVDLFAIAAGFFSSFFLLLRLKPVLLFSKGGFVSVPPCLAARFLGIPVITHESDFSPGLATRINARSASGIFVSCEETRMQFPEKLRPLITVTGNPVRPAFYAASAEKGRLFLGCNDSTLPVLFVQGGSLGARQINDLVAGCIDELCRHFFVVHQTGPQNTDQAVHSGNSLTRERYKSFAFIREQMPDVLASSAVVLARSGANTVWECAASGKPMILVPLEKGSSRGDQIENAQFFVSRGAAVMLTGENATAEKLVQTLAGLLQNTRLYEDMASNSAALGSVRPAALIAELLEKRISGGSK
jgi:UDP-N-acetylglucosamine--N-acetylmuramyl-(pentapeptide) pyrophosphoryl-undecaprenol N-acetylglucosamine transferase